ncbi:hypothetical protein ISN45_At05g053670 [Arabidopsis thaliana x Arabidopsis arenosa]|uniref:Uncharacterized protein n=2 Tax=Arabidopsis TaxID=3701 RepID=A0A8T2E103_ARASU|nr:hypothetical protein ISN45_At05g053670 [Arabidopsis thaliana x Arabidopsis arenosa]KAG7613371.1 hypothetical protein ISN44_As05g052930 [Arabidopsis suecica]
MVHVSDILHHPHFAPTVPASLESFYVVLGIALCKYACL